MDGLFAGATKLSLRSFAYAGARFPAEVRADSERAVEAHPDIVLLPVGFGVAERDRGGRLPCGTLTATPHDARRRLYDAMTEAWPTLYRFDDARRAAYARTAEEFRAADRADGARVGDDAFRTCRIQRMVRSGPDGPEPPRPSDHDEYGIGDRRAAVRGAHRAGRPAGAAEQQVAGHRFGADRRRGRLRPAAVGGGDEDVRPLPRRGDGAGTVRSGERPAQLPSLQRDQRDGGSLCRRAPSAPRTCPGTAMPASAAAEATGSAASATTGAVTDSVWARATPPPP
ncbi:DUF5954 family protein [Streptomyces brasiliensis]|uniref:Uncharacterized protein n=1 Tax=Streptomyces brasiliensis TaxID=1954 RepID=A0A917K217_9ACTN|nr:hypothetical protein GCM10010121_005290 [Streptomyces brasiliensis]